MTLLRGIGEFVSRWLEGVAAMIVAALGRFVSPRVVRIVEESDGRSFTLSGAENGGGRRDRLAASDRGPFGALTPDAAKAIKGNRLEVVLRPSRFLFRPLELPRRAVEFLDGIVRAQIDRLTPWTPGEAVFSWTPPTDTPNDRIELTIAATARALVAPYVQAIADLGVASVAVLTVPADAGPHAAPIKVFEQRARGVFEIDRIRRTLVALFLISGLAAAVTMGYSAFALDSLDTEQQTLSQKIATRRAALRASPEFTVSAQRMLERRKQSTPSNVIVLEALSQILPDHTFVTEIRIEVDKLQIVGVTRDAAALIALIEQSPHFTSARFYAPTTRTPGDPGERFHVEAKVKPIFAVGT